MILLGIRCEWGHNDDRGIQTFSGHLLDKVTLQKNKLLAGEGTMVKSTWLSFQGTQVQFLEVAQQLTTELQFQGIHCPLLASRHIHGGI